MGSGEFWYNSGTILVCSGGVLVGSGDFWWILVGLLWVLLSSGRFLVGSGEFW